MSSSHYIQRLTHNYALGLLTLRNSLQQLI